HQVPSGLLQPIRIPEWKWDRVTMDFVSGLPLTRKKHDAVWVIVDRLTNSAHFLPVRTDYSLEKLAELYISEIVRLHGIPLSIISNRDPRFTSRFWKKLHESLGTQLHFSTAFHPQTDGQSERVIQVLEDMLRSCVIEFEGSWDRYLPLAEFAYNNSYQASIQMAPYEALYERKCRTPVCWTELGEDKLVGQKSYADLKRKEIEHAVGDKVFLKVSPWKKVLSFGRKGKEEIEIQPDMTYEEEPLRILAREVKELRNKQIPLVKGLWRHHNTEEATWESEETMRQQFPQLFASGKFRGRNLN
ncbi:hypothetical protein P3X46_034358, partial [Hevea brasiliensis]